MTVLALSIVVLPFFGFSVGAFLDRFWSQLWTCSLSGLAALCALWLAVIYDFSDKTLVLSLVPWIHVEFLEVNWGIQIDSLSLVMISVVTPISFLVHLYSVGYMKGDEGIPRFMAYLSLFTFFMLILVTAPNFLQLFFGWEGVGLASYLLIGYWYKRETAQASALKAFLMNRIADIGFVVGICTLFIIFGTLDFSAIFGLVDEHQKDIVSFLGVSCPAIPLACTLLFIGAMGKSAQIGFHTWLPDAMEAPTPVSALLHAATMVTAGVFLMVRISPLLEYAPVAREVMIIIGALTALITAANACVQNDIKRIIAYSTCSQLGYMFIAAGLSGYSASLFHLTTHAFFKALLFLGAGAVIHGMSDEHDIQKMGGIWRYIPLTYAIMWVGSLALAGIPFFSGFYSKDIILNIAWVSSFPTGQMAYLCGVSAAFLTAFYAWRLLFLTFHGTPRANEAVMGHIHESPISMLIPMMVLSTGAIVLGYALFDFFVGEDISFWETAIPVLPENNLLDAAYHVGWKETSWLVLVPLLGIGLAYVFYIKYPSIPDRMEALFRPFYNFFQQNCYVDKIYTFLGVTSVFNLGQVLWEKGEKTILENLGPRGLGTLSLVLSRILCHLQTGHIYHYALAMMLGIVVLIGWYYGIFFHLLGHIRGFL